MVWSSLGDGPVLGKMNRAFISPVVRPNLPLRRPASGPGMVSPTCILPQPTEQVCYQTPEQPTPEVKGKFFLPACWIWSLLDRGVRVVFTRHIFVLKNVSAILSRQSWNQAAFSTTVTHKDPSRGRIATADFFASIYSKVAQQISTLLDWTCKSQTVPSGCYWKCKCTVACS